MFVLVNMILEVVMILCGDVKRGCGTVFACLRDASELETTILQEIQLFINVMHPRLVTMTLMQICKYAVCKYFICKYATMQVCNYASL